MASKEILTKAFLKEANIDGDTKEWYGKLWRNLRKNHPSMRLTKDGYNFLTKQVKLNPPRYATGCFIEQWFSMRLMINYLVFHQAHDKLTIFSSGS